MYIIFASLNNSIQLPSPQTNHLVFFTFESLVPNCGDPIGLRWCCGNDSCVAEPEPRLEAPTSEELRRRLRRKGTGRCTGACGPSEAKAATNLEECGFMEVMEGENKHHMSTRKNHQIYLFFQVLV